MAKLKIVAQEILMCGLKNLPLIGPAVDIVNAVQTKHEILSHGDRINSLEQKLTAFERQMRDLVKSEMQNSLSVLQKARCDSSTLNEHVRNLLEIQKQGWSPLMFSGLLAGSPHWNQIQDSPHHFGTLLQNQQQPDKEKMQVFIDVDSKPAVLELAPFTFASLLSNQAHNSKATLQSAGADVWATAAGSESEKPFLVHGEGTPPPPLGTKATREMGYDDWDLMTLEAIGDYRFGQLTKRLSTENVIVPPHPRTQFDEKRLLSLLKQSVSWTALQKFKFLKTIPSFDQEGIDKVFALLEKENYEFSRFRPTRLVELRVLEEAAVADWKALQSLDSAAILDYVDRNRREYDQMSEMERLEEQSFKEGTVLGEVGFGYFLGKAEGRKARGDLEEALAYINAAIRLRPDEEDGYLTRACVYREQSRLDAALKDCNKAIEINSVVPELYDERAEVLAQLGKVSEAEADRERAKTLLGEFGSQSLSRRLQEESTRLED